MWYMDLRLRRHWRSLSRLSGQAECMVYALFLPFWPLVRLATWLLISFMATVFYKEAMVWLSGRFLRVSAWRQFFSTLLLPFLEGRNGHLLRAFSLALFLMSWACSVPFTILPLRKMTLCHCLSRLGTLSGNSLFLQTPFLGCDPVVGAGTAIVTALGLWMSRFLLW